MSKKAHEGKLTGAVRKWLLNDRTGRRGSHQGPHGHDACGQHSWWRVMCVTGVDYFSTLAYQPAIAVAVAGMVAPLAALVLVLITLCCALPMYRRVAKESPRGSGSIAMLEKLLPWWGGKLLVLILLGFIVTDFMITITLSSSDAAAHAVHSPYAPDFLHGMELPISVGLILLLGYVFLRGFNEAINIAVVLVFLFLTLTGIVIFTALTHIDGVMIGNWWEKLLVVNGNPFMIVLAAMLFFPRLALGLSGFETGVTVMPQIRNSRIKGDCDGCVNCSQEEKYQMRIKGARRLLTTAAAIMSLFLVTSNFVATLLIPSSALEEGGAAQGRALAYLSELYLGDTFATVYDVSTICILWFAGASAMAGMLNVIPRYLPRYGMAPQWIRFVRPLVIVVTLTATAIVTVFSADVEAQGAAYATGVLALITSASLAVTLSAWRQRQKPAFMGFSAVTLIFVYTTVTTVAEKPSGIQVASAFIFGIILISLLSRLRRSFDIRATSINFDNTASDFVCQDAEDYGSIHILAHDPGKIVTGCSKSEYNRRLQHERLQNKLAHNTPIIFIEVHKSDSSDFEEELEVTGQVAHGYRILHVKSGNIPNTIAAVLLEIRDITGVVPDVYFHWTERNPISNTFRYLITGTGEVAAVTREVLREAESKHNRRPAVHVS